MSYHKVVNSAGRAYNLPAEVSEYRFERVPDSREEPSQTGM